MKTVDDYTGLIEPQHADKPKFVATVALSADVMARFQAFLASMPAAFDLDSAIGVQLDANGVRIGRSRYLSLPLPSPWFTWGDPNRGWGRGIWKSVYDQGDYLSALDDDTYRRLLKAKVLANRWDGTPEMLEAIYEVYFNQPATKVFVQDMGDIALPENYFTWGDPARGWGQAFWHQPGSPFPDVVPTDMAITIGVAGKIPNVIDLGLIAQDLVGPKPEGVRVTHAVTSVDGAPLFGWGMQNDFISGWGTGAWAVTPDFAIANPPVV